MDEGQNYNGKGVEQASEEEKQKHKVCKRCKEQYAASSNTPTSCRFHLSFFVCRRHDDQKRYLFHIFIGLHMYLIVVFQNNLKEKQKIGPGFLKNGILWTRESWFMYILCLRYNILTITDLRDSMNYFPPPSIPIPQWH